MRFASFRKDRPSAVRLTRCFVRSRSLTPSSLSKSLTCRVNDGCVRCNFQEGTGTMSTESQVLADTQYSFRTRFAKGIGTNPDELIAASLGGCFSMALANELGLAGFNAERIETTATATLEQLALGWTLTRMQLDVHAKVPHATHEHFIDAALAAKTK